MKSKLSFKPAHPLTHNFATIYIKITQLLLESKLYLISETAPPIRENQPHRYYIYTHAL